MYKTTLALAAVALAAVGVRDRQQHGPALHLKEEAMVLEYTATAGEATIVVQAESEMGLGRVEVCAPNGKPVIRLGADNGQSLSVSGFVIETQETTTQNLLQTYQEGTYELRAWTVDGKAVTGSARLSHSLLPTPIVMHPFEGQLVSAQNLEIRWLADPQATSYQVVLEQGDSDTLVVTLPAGTNSFAVPNGVLAPGLLSHVEVAAVNRNGNRTLAEVAFTTL